MAAERITGRTAFGDTEQVFRLETCRASNVFLPAAKAEDLVPRDDFVGPEIFGEHDSFLRVPGFHQPPAIEIMKRAGERRWRKKLEEVRIELAAFKGISLWWSDSVRGSQGLPGGGQPVFGRELPPGRHGPVRRLFRILGAERTVF
jgi:hypothetical protein